MTTAGRDIYSAEDRTLDLTKILTAATSWNRAQV